MNAEAPAGMRGFDPEFADLPDYILKITERIWEGRRPDLIRRYYTERCVVRGPDAVVVGADGVVRTTLEMLHEFPDRRLLGEDVIWAGNDDDGYFSSHRILSTMHHLGDGAFGPATNRPVRVRTIADCAVRENRIHEEWLVRDRGAIARQIGLDVRTLAAGLSPPGDGDPPDGIPVGSHVPILDDDAEARAYADGWRSLWQEQRLATLNETRHPAVMLELPGGETATGIAAMDRFLVGYLAAFPGSRFRPEHLVIRRDPGLPARVAMRWTAEGTHDGRGAFGPPSGVPVRIAGINHAHIAGGRVVAEWIVVDEVAVWGQILRGGRAADRRGSSGAT